MLRIKNLTLDSASNSQRGGGKLYERFLPIVSQNREKTDFYRTD